MENLLEAGCRGQTVKLMWMVVIVVLSIMAVPRASAASFRTGNSLLYHCTSLNLDYCFGYTSGIADAMSDGVFVSGYRACVPAGVTNGQLKDVVVQLLQRYPGQRHLTANSLVARALSEAFPCK